jgi:peptidoglycan/xylan/chitin deacetylase (PgdA/CDA1 family)
MHTHATTLEQDSALPAAHALRQRARQSAKALGQLLLPRSLVVWRGRGAAPMPGKVALTFDDGPDSLTPDYLAVLDTLGVRATFFVVGENCQRHPELVDEMLRRGHEVASHGYTHRRFTELSSDQLWAELEQTRALLPRQPGDRALVRPPFGAVSPRSLLTCARAGFTTVLWSLNSGDWCNRDAAAVSRQLHTAPVSAGEIVLLHEGQPWTINALPEIIGGLKKDGHELVTVSELLA